MGGFNGSGTYVRYYNWTNDAAANIKIRADRMDTEDNGFATGLSTCLTKDGQTTPTANLKMATFRHTGVGDGQARTDYASVGQSQDGIINWVVAGGTADALTANYAIPLTALVDGQYCFVRAASANATTTPTFSPSGLTAHTITKFGGSALVAGDVAGADHELVLRYKLASTRWELLNPAISAGSITNAQLAGNIALTKLATQSANTFLAEATGSSAPPTAIALSASQLAGRGSSGNIAPITLDSTLTMSGANLSVTTPAPVVAAQSDQETATSTTKFVSPGRQQFHPSAAKAWIKFNTVTTTANLASYNVASLTDNGVGDTTVTLTTSFSGADYGCIVGFEAEQNSPGSGRTASVRFGGQAAGSVRTLSFNSSGSAIDLPGVHVAMFGDQ